MQPAPVAGVPSAGLGEVFDKVFGTKFTTDGAEIQLPRKIPIRVEPKSYFANERTFLAWIHMAVVLGFVSSAITGFTVAQEGIHPSEKAGPLSPKFSELVQLILLPLGIVVVAYGLFTFYWRSRFMQKKQVGFFDDRFGPIILCCLIMGALIFIFFLALYDLFN